MNTSHDFKLNHQLFNPSILQVAILFLTLFVAVPTLAEDNCGVMILNIARVNGVVKSINPLAGWTGDILESDDIDPRYVVSVSVTSVENADKSNVALNEAQKDTTLNFAIHSPAQFFSGAPSIGQSIQLQVEAMQCDGSFRRFTRIIRSSSNPEQFSGNLEVGTTYRATVHLSDSGEIQLTIPIKVPYHHMVGVDWDNPTDLPKRGPDLRTQTVVFKVTSKSIRQVSERGWATSYKLLLTRISR